MIETDVAEIELWRQVAPASVETSRDDPSIAHNPPPGNVPARSTLASARDGPAEADGAGDIVVADGTGPCCWYGEALGEPPGVARKPPGRRPRARATATIAATAQTAAAVGQARTTTDDRGARCSSASAIRMLNHAGAGLDSIAA